MVTEDAELVRRRGRWMAHRTMDIYLQEALASVYFPRLPVLVKAKVLHLALAFPATLNRMKMMTDGGLSPGMRYDFSLCHRWEEWEHNQGGRPCKSKGAENKTKKRLRNKRVSSCA